MKVLVSWLGELAEIPVPPATLAHDLHMIGFEVASVERPEAGPDSDALIDFEITANRPDCLSLAGLAREVATYYRTSLRSPAGADMGAPHPSAAAPLEVVIEDPVRCPRYCAALLDVTVGPSPDWLVARLTAAGIRSINNIVDVTNYVLVETGHPLHAFDLARLAGPRIRVRAAAPNETLITLDGQKRTLDPEMVVIGDADRAQALGGIMGGADSEVSAGTRTIALEAAWFQPASIRRGSRRLGLSTEASYRFERGADVAAPPLALARACALIEQLGAGKVRPGWVDAWPSPRRPAIVRLVHAQIPSVLGVSVQKDEVERILEGLGFEVEFDGEIGWDVQVPSWRVDVSRDVDLIEEVARHHGYDRLPASFPSLAHAPSTPKPRMERDRALRRLATAAGFSECVTFSFIGRRAALEVASEEDVVSLANPLSETFAVLRPSLLPGLVDAIGHNRRHGQRDVRLFELGARFLRQGGEHTALALAWIGAAVQQHWSGKPRGADFFDLKGAVTALGGALGLALRFAPVEHAFLVRGRAAAVLATSPQSERVVGIAGQLRPEIADARDLPPQDDVYVAELDLETCDDLLTLLEVPRARTLPRFPSVVRDLSILVGDGLPAATVRGTIQTAAPPTLVRIAEFDRYQGTGIPDGKVSLSYHLTFQASDRTLTDSEVDAAMAAVLEALSTAHGAVRR